MRIFWDRLSSQHTFWCTWAGIYPHKYGANAAEGCNYLSSDPQAPYTSISNYTPASTASHTPNWIYPHRSHTPRCQSHRPTRARNGYHLMLLCWVGWMMKMGRFTNRICEGLCGLLCLGGFRWRFFCTFFRLRIFGDGPVCSSSPIIATLSKPNYSHSIIQSKDEIQSSINYPTSPS